MTRKSRWFGGLIAAGAWAAAGSGFAQDFTWNFDSIDNLNWRLTAVSNTQVFSGTLPAFEPLINLQIGKRYQVTVSNSSFHPFQVIAKGPTDVVQLSQGNVATGLLESDPGIAWSDDLAGNVQFTVTQKLVDAMSVGGRIPGYRCNQHTNVMRGDFNIVSAASNEQFTFDIDGTANFSLTNVSSSLIFGGTLPANDPTLILTVGQRYRVTVTDPVAHPLEFVGRGASAATDIVLLSQGSAVQGILEDNPGVAWFDDGSGIVDFTLTQSLANAMAATGRSPGYRCRNHPNDMRGAIVIGEAGPNAAKDDKIYE